MRCPFCRKGDTKVYDSRPHKRESEISRRRECLSSECQKRFTTVEMVVEVVLKGTRKKNSVEKLNFGGWKGEVMHVTSEVFNELDKQGLLDWGTHSDYPVHQGALVIK